MQQRITLSLSLTDPIRLPDFSMVGDDLLVPNQLDRGNSFSKQPIMTMQGEKNLPQRQAGALVDASGFQPFLVAMQKKVKKIEALRAASGDGVGGASKVEVVESEGLVEGIKVRCKCGEVTWIECDYSDK